MLQAGRSMCVTLPVPLSHVTPGEPQVGVPAEGQRQFGLQCGPFVEL